jgi:hypothetical protein
MVRVTTKGPDTGYVAPTRDQLRSLRKIVLATYPRLVEGAPTDELAAEREFLCAFWAQGQFYRGEPNEKQSFVSLLDIANDKLVEHGCQSIGANAFIAACWAAGDVPIRLANGKVGQLLAIGLVSDRQGQRCNPGRWQAIAAGQANLLSPTPPRAGLTERAVAQNQISFHRREPDGSMRPLRADEALWSRS